MEDKALNDERYYDLFHQEEIKEPEVEDNQQEKAPETGKHVVFRKSKHCIKIKGLSFINASSLSIEVSNFKELPV